MYDYRQPTVECNPYQNYINLCSQSPEIGTRLHSVTRINTGQKSIVLKPNMVCHISNFSANSKELEQAKKLSHDAPMNPVNLEHLKKFGNEFYNKMYNLCHKEYADVWAKHQFHIKPIPNKEFRIDLKPESMGMKIYKPQYHLNDVKRQVYTYHAMQNVKNGLYEPTSSMHNVPVIVIPRKDKRLRLAYDLTKLNSHTKDLQSHIPSYNWLFGLLAGRGYYTTTDIKNFFENIPIAKKHRPLCAITTPIGRFQLTNATYGFKNIATIAQEISEEVAGIEGRTAAFIDDIFIHHGESADLEELFQEATKLLSRARNVGVLLHPEKTFFFVPEVEFLGYIFTQEGHKPQSKYLRKVLKIKKPNKVKEIQAYLGLIQYIARYLHKFADWSHYLTILTRKTANKKWGPAQDIAFEQLQNQIRKIKMLYHPTNDGPFLVQCDASKFAIGAVLFQLQYDKVNRCKQWKIIEFYSKQLDQQLIKHPIMIKECLAMVYSFNHWRHFLLRKKFYVDTDHKNLISLFDDDETKAPAMRKMAIFQRMRMATAMFPFEVKHNSGADQIVADYLSRDGNDVNDMCLPIELSNSEFDNKSEQIAFLNAVDNHHKLRHHIFATIHIQRVQFYDKLNYNYINKLCNRPYSLNTLMIDYIRDHGYICNVIRNKATRKSIQFANKRSTYTKRKHLYKHIKLSNRTLKSCMKSNKNKNSHTKLITNLHDSLSIALTNTLRNTPKPTSKTISHLTSLATLYNICDRTDPNLYKNKSLNKIYTVSTKGENYHMNNDYIRRSRRKRVQTKQFWEQPLLAEKLNNELNSSSSDDDESKEMHLETANDESNCNNFDKPNKPCDDKNNSIRNNFAINESQMVTFPFAVAPTIQQQLYDQLYLPEEYSKVLSGENVKLQQSIDHVGKHIMKILQSNDNKSRIYLNANYKHVYKLIRSDQFYLIDNVIYVRSNKRYRNPRLFIPSKLIHSLLKYEHTINNLNHPGAQVMIRSLTKKYYWTWMNKDIIGFVLQCKTCQLGKGTKKLKVGRLAPTKATYYGHVVHFDFAGPFWGTVSILVMTCATTGVVLLHVCRNQDAANVIHALVHRWYPVHGLPVKIVTDRGTGFIARANQLASQALGIQNIFTSAYHPQTNAKAERVVQEVKKALRMINIDLDERYTTNLDDARHVRQCVKELTLLLPSIQFAINQRIHTVTQTSPHMLIYGRNLRDIVDLKLARKTIDKIPLDFEHQTHFEIVKQLKAMLKLRSKEFRKRHRDYVIIMKNNFDLNHHNDNFSVGDAVAYYVGDRAETNKKLHSRFTGPWEVIDRLRHNTVRIKNLDNNDELACHTSMLKKYHKDAFVPLIELKRSERAKHRSSKRRRKKKPNK